MTKFIVLQICALALVISLGFVALSQVVILRAENQALVAGQSVEFYRGAYAACRTFAEGLFAVPSEIAILQCNEMARQARNYGLAENDLWNSGYAK